MNLLSSAHSTLISTCDVLFIIIFLLFFVNTPLQVISFIHIYDQYGAAVYAVAATTVVAVVFGVAAAAANGSGGDGF